MSRSVDAEGSAISPESYDAIQQAVLESERGRWFLDEYARRLRSSDTATLLTAIGKLEAAVATNQNFIADRLGKALGLATLDDQTAIAPAQPLQLTPRHMKYFKLDEDLFVPPAKKDSHLAAVDDEPKTEVARGARFVIRRRSDTQAKAVVSEIAAPAVEAPPPPPQTFALREQPAAVAPPKRRIVIIRHKAGEDIDVPLQNEMAASA